MMKKSMLLILLVTTWATVSAQLTENEQSSMLGSHEGFYLSASVGPVFGTINDQMTGSSNSMIKFSGTGGIFDIRLGLAMGNNFIAHAAIISSGVAGPTIQVNNEPSVKTTNEIGIGEALIGVGVTKYIMPENIFFAGTIGMGNFTLIDDTGDTKSYTTERGLGFQLKIGKEWLLGSQWGLGIAGTYGRTNVKYNVTLGDSEHLTSNRFGIVLNATFNRVR